MRRWKRKHRLKLKWRVKILLVIGLLLCLFIILFVYYDVKLRPIIRDVATSKAGDYATEIINDTVYDVLEKNDVSYEDIVDMQKDESGNIIAVSVDTVKVNKLRNEIALELSRRTDEVQSIKIKIPLGNFFDSGFLSDTGPDIDLSVLPTSSIYTDVEQDFSSAGINQTIHRISFRATVAFDLIFPNETVTEEYTSLILVAQTVIVGKVPDTYAQIDTSAKDAMSYIGNKKILAG